MSEVLDSAAARSLTELVATLESAPWGARGFDEQVWCALGHELRLPTTPGFQPHQQWIESDGTRRSLESTLFTTNIHCALSLVPTDPRGGWYWRCGSGSLHSGWAHLNRLDSSHCDKDDEVTSYAQTPALALCAAVLRIKLALLRAAATAQAPQG